MKKLFFSILVFATVSVSAQVQKIQNLQITGGSPGKGMVLTSDSTGNATWMPSPGSSATGTTVSVTVVSPIHSASGKVWMDRNLGASRRPQSVTDYMAYGQLYQWGRGNDGHADVVWISATAGASANGNTTTLSTTDYPNNNLFILSSTGANDWRATPNNNLWQGVAGVNNPCPAGYRLPTNAEITTEVTTYSITNLTAAFASPLRFTASGYRNNANGILGNLGTDGLYWSSTVVGGLSSLRHFGATEVPTYEIGRAYAFSVRCIKD